MFYLLSDRNVYVRLQSELDAAFPNADAPLDSRTLTDLPYLNAVVDEGLRLGTPFPGLRRVVPKGGVIIDEAFIPEGTTVGVPAYSQETSEENFWPEPKAFKPERWLPGGLGPDSRTRKSALMAFSFGLSFRALFKSFTI